MELTSFLYAVLVLMNLVAVALKMVLMVAQFIRSRKD